MSANKKTVVICGGGNGAHVLTSFASQHFNVRLLSLFQDEAARFKASLGDGLLTAVTIDEVSKVEKIQVQSKPALITNQVKEAFTDCDLVLLCIPSFSHRLYLESLLPYLRPGLPVLGFPGGSGFEFEAIDVLGAKIDDIIIASSESLPWACRIIQFGQKVEVCGFKDDLIISRRVGKNVNLAGTMLEESILQKLIGPSPKLNIRGDILGLTLNNPNPKFHMPVMYGMWGPNWDGKPVNRVPYFYREVNQEMVKIIHEIDKEVSDVCKAIKAVKPNIDLSTVTSDEEWFIRVYGSQIVDRSSYLKMVQTMSAHSTILHPVTQVGDNQWVPNFAHRFLTEEIPCGLVVFRGIASLVNVPTPTVDKLIEWGQKHMGKEYLINGKLEGQHVKETRAPQRYGLTQISHILG